jgi:hypothetical protein
MGLPRRGWAVQLMYLVRVEKQRKEQEQEQEEGVARLCSMRTVLGIAAAAAAVGTAYAVVGIAGVAVVQHMPHMGHTCLHLYLHHPYPRDRTAPRRTGNTALQRRRGSAYRYTRSPFRRLWLAW